MSKFTHIFGDIQPFHPTFYSAAALLPEERPALIVFALVKAMKSSTNWLDIFSRSCITKAPEQEPLLYVSF